MSVSQTDRLQGLWFGAGSHDQPTLKQHKRRLVRRLKHLPLQNGHVLINGQSYLQSPGTVVRNELNMMGASHDDGVLQGRHRHLSRKEKSGKTASYLKRFPIDTLKIERSLSTVSSYMIIRSRFKEWCN